MLLGLRDIYCTLFPRFGRHSSIRALEVSNMVCIVYNLWKARRMLPHEKCNRLQGLFMVGDCSSSS